MPPAELTHKTRAYLKAPARGKNGEICLNLTYQTFRLAYHKASFEPNFPPSEVKMHLRLIAKPEILGLRKKAPEVKAKIPPENMTPEARNVQNVENLLEFNRVN